MRQTLLKAVILISVSTEIAAQSANVDSRPEFEVAAMKSSDPQVPGQLLNINLGTARNGRVTLGNATLADCIRFAYGLISDAEISGPDWIKSRDVRFDIVAQAAPDTPRDQLLRMLQRLLSERVKLQLHHEQRPLSYLALIVARNGPKLRPGVESSEPPVLGGGRITHHQLSMPVLASLLSRFERQLILDMTELFGVFDITLEWTPDALKGRAPEGGGPILLNGMTIDPNGPSLVSALQEQLGLRLDSRKGPVDMLVVDHAEKVPTPN